MHTLIETDSSRARGWVIFYFFFRVVGWINISSATCHLKKFITKTTLLPPLHDFVFDLFFCCYTRRLLCTLKRKERNTVYWGKRNWGRGREEAGILECRRAWWSNVTRGVDCRRKNWVTANKAGRAMWKRNKENCCSQLALSFTHHANTRSHTKREETPWGAK